MADEKKNAGPGEPIVLEAPSPDIPGAPSVTEQGVKQGTIPGMEEVSDPSTTVINFAAAHEAAKQTERPAPGAKKVKRYIRLNSLVPELLNMVDEKKLGFMPAVEISYINPKNQRLIAVSIDGEPSSPSHAQAKKMRELDKEGKLTGDVIDGILSKKKKEDRGVIISTSELEKYFGKEATPSKMKEQIMSLLYEWKEKQPPELNKPEKKADKTL